MQPVAAADREADAVVERLGRRPRAPAPTGTIPRIASIGSKSAASCEVDVEVERLAVVGAHEQRLLDLLGAGEPAFEPELQALQRQHPAARQRQRGVRQLVHRLRAGRRGGDEQPRPHAVDAQLVAGEEAAVVAVDAERVRLGDREGPVARAITAKTFSSLMTIVSARLTSAPGGRLGVRGRVAGAGRGRVGFEMPCTAGCPL